MKFTKEELDSPLWAKLKELWNERLAKLRADNDKNMNDVETYKLRGRIAEVKANLDLDKPKQEIEIE